MYQVEVTEARHAAELELENKPSLDAKMSTRKLFRKEMAVVHSGKGYFPIYKAKQMDRRGKKERKVLPRKINPTPVGDADCNRMLFRIHACIVELP